MNKSTKKNYYKTNRLRLLHNVKKNDKYYEWYKKDSENSSLFRIRHGCFNLNGEEINPEKIYHNTYIDISQNQNE